MNKNEECWIIYGVNIGPFFVGFTKKEAEGDPASVTFDWEKNLHKRVLGGLHTHPFQKRLHMSSIDHRTMRSWVKAKDRAQICGIKNESRSRFFCFMRCPSIKVLICYYEMTFVLMGPFFAGFRAHYLGSSEDR